MTLFEVFQYDFMLVALAISVLVAVVCATFSCFLILKGWSLMGDALSHAVLPGIVAAYALGLPLAMGAFASGLLCAFGSGLVKAHSRIKEDTVVGVIFTGLFALGLVLMSRVQSDRHLTHILFGNLLGIPHSQLVQMWFFGGLALLAIFLLRHDLLLFCFDPGHARAIGLNVTFLHYTMLILLALVIVISLQAVGVILVVAMLILPGATGFLLCDRFGPMQLVAILSAALASGGGLWASFLLDAAPAACIVLAQATLFMMALFFAPKRGLLFLRQRHAP